MTRRAADPRKLDVRQLARDSGELVGVLPQGQLTRLASSLMPPLVDGLPPPVHWSAQGTQRAVPGGVPEIWLHLRGDSIVRVECQRCLQPLNQPLQVDRHLRFVLGDDEAARLDEDSEHDVLALVARLDVIELLEDELILALPLVPRHEVCPHPLAPAQVGSPNATPDPRPHPFAALADWRGKPPTI